MCLVRLYRRSQHHEIVVGLLTARKMRVFGTFACILMSFTPRWPRHSISKDDTDDSAAQMSDPS